MGRRALSSKRAIRFRDLAQPLRGRQILHHDRESFPAAALALAQQAYRAIVGRVAGQMKSTQALDGDNFALREQPPRSFENRPDRMRELRRPCRASSSARSSASAGPQSGHALGSA